MRARGARVATPVLTIDSGDVVRLHTASGNPRYYEALGVPKDKIPADLYRVFQGVEDALRWDHTLNGPICVKDAARGDTIEIRIRSVDVWLPLAGQSFTPNRGLLPEDFPYRRDRDALSRSREEDRRLPARRGATAQAILGRDGRRTACRHGPRAERPAERLRRQHAQRISVPAARSTCPSTRGAHCCRLATVTLHRGTARCVSPRSKRR